MKDDALREYIWKYLDYVPNTGKFIWCGEPATHTKIGKTVGHKNEEGYIKIRINYKLYSAHRLAWFYTYGSWPKYNIDHINGVRDDNRIINLRTVSRRENAQNMCRHRNGKLVGAHFNKLRNYYQSAISINGKVISLGVFKTEIEAHRAYIEKQKTIINKKTWQ